MESKSDNLALYAAIKTFFKDDHDPWSAVAIFTILIIEEGDSINEIQRKFVSKYKIDIPEDALKTIISRLRRNSLITYTSLQAISLTAEGKTTIATQNKSVSSIRREFLALINDLKKYLQKQGIKELDKVEEELLNFIDGNIGFTSNVISGSSKKSENDSKIAKYIIEVEKSKPDLYKILQNVFFGRVFLSLIRARADIDAKAKFNKLLVYLDTNILFNLLGLHGVEAERSSSELIKILSKYNIEVSIFDITVKESLSVLNAYISQSGNYTKEIKVDSIYSRFKGHNMSRHDIQLIIENFEKSIEKLGIRIKNIERIEEDALKKSIQALSSAAHDINQSKNDRAIEHDSMAIESVNLQRKNVRTKLLEKSQSIFITADRSVYNYSVELASKDNNFPLALRPVDIVSLLWIKSIGDKEVGASALRHVVMGYARERMISHNLWEEFMVHLNDAAKKGDITKEDIALIMSSDETERILIDDQRNAPKKIINQSHISKLRKKNKDTQLAKENAETKLSKIDKRIKSFSNKAAIILSIIIWSVSLTSFFLVAKKLIISLGGINNVASWITVITIPALIALSLIFGDNFKFTAKLVYVRNRLLQIIERKIYNLLKNLINI